MRKVSDLKKDGHPYSTEVFVLGGLPLIAAYHWMEDDPSVGFWGGPEDVCLYTLKGQRAEWAEKRLSKEDWESLNLTVAEQHEEKRYAGYE